MGLPRQHGLAAVRGGILNFLVLVFCLLVTTCLRGAHAQSSSAAYIDVSQTVLSAAAALNTGHRPSAVFVASNNEVAVAVQRAVDGSAAPRGEMFVCAGGSETCTLRQPSVNCPAGHCCFAAPNLEGGQYPGRC